MEATHEAVVGFDHAVRCGLCPLNRVRPGIRVKIKKLCSSPGMAQRLREMGLCEEQVIQRLSCGTNIICVVCNTRLALSALLAQSILVEPLSLG